MHNLIALPYSLYGLEPIISAETMDFHYYEHHHHYVEKLNSLIQDNSCAEMNLEDLVVNSGGTIQQNAAQVWNHNFFWYSLRSPHGLDCPPLLLKLIEEEWGSMDTFKDEFKMKALEHFGSGWIWLVQDEDRLRILTTSNEKNPFMENLNSLIVLDLWEHAYHIDHRNRRESYIDSFWSIIDWERASNRLFEESILPVSRQEGILSTFLMQS